MKKLYRKGTVHPSPPIISDHLAFLPATILTLAAALTPEDREVLAYLISCSATNFSSGQIRNTTTDFNDHPPLFSCDCFRCYLSYWVRWDSSPNRQLIHEIIDAFEDGLVVKNKKKGKNSKKDRKKRNSTNSRSSSSSSSVMDGGLGNLKTNEDLVVESGLVNESGFCSGHGGEANNGSGGGGGGGEEEERGEKGSVRRFVSFIGEKIWGVFGGNEIEAI